MANKAASYDVPTIVTTGGFENLLTTNEAPVDMHASMFDSYTSLTPLTTILAKLADNPAHNVRIDWQEKSEVPTTIAVGTTETSAGTSVEVVAGGYTLVLGTMLYNPRVDDLRYVNTAPASATTIKVSVDQGGKTSAAWKAGDILHVMLPVLAENDENYRTASVVDSNVFNYQQLCKIQYAITRTNDKVSTHFGGAGSKRQELKGQKYREFRIKKEKSLYFGGRATSGTNDSIIRLAGGMNHYLRDGTLYKDYNGIMTESGFRNFLGDYKSQNPDATSVYVFAAGNVVDLITNFGTDKVRISPKSKEFGLDILTYKARGITAQLVAMPLLDVPITEGWGFILDLDRIMLKTLDRDMFYPEAKNIGESEKIIDTYRGLFSLLVGNESRHAMFVNAYL